MGMKMSSPVANRVDEIPYSYLKPSRGCASYFVIVALYKHLQQIFFFRCPKCGVEICSEKCAQNQFHLLECDLLASAKLEKWEFPELRTPLRCLGMKEKDPKKYAQLRSLVSNTDVKVSCTT